MQVIYSRRWNFLRNRPIDELTADEARRRDQSGELYTVILGDVSDPDAVIEVAWDNKHLGVYFFDSLQRQSIHYSFRRLDEGTLFLGGMTRWQYGDETALQINEAELIEKIRYEQNGIVHREVRDKKANERTRTDYRDVSLDINYEPVPKFGDWASVARFERDKPAST